MNADPERLMQAVADALGGSAIATTRALAEEVRELLADPVDRSADA